ncbi:MAG: hypothetical protein GY696_37625 [Gammaproteobacteria bacterium]|nr:hypothetical protein [Gammaproteobacteria bacterium]
MMSHGSLIHDGVGPEDPKSLRSKESAEICVLLQTHEASISPQVGHHHDKIHGESPDPLTEVNCGVRRMFLEWEKRRD